MCALSSDRAWCSHWPRVYSVRTRLVGAIPTKLDKALDSDRIYTPLIAAAFHLQQVLAFGVHGE